MIKDGADDLSRRTALLRHTGAIVSAYLSRNMLAVHELPRLLAVVHESLAGLTSDAPERHRPMPAVPIKKSVTPGYLICLEDGKKLKLLKRYLRTAHDLSPSDYRARWGLPTDYPMVAPNYAKRRSELAKTIGLGTRPSRAKRQG